VIDPDDSIEKEPVYCLSGVGCLFPRTRVREDVRLLFSAIRQDHYIKKASFIMEKCIVSNTSVEIKSMGRMSGSEYSFIKD